MIFGKNISL